MTKPERFHVSNPNLIHDNIQGEVILLNLETGTYYQVRGTGVWVWNLLVAGISLQEIKARLTLLYPDAATVIESELGRFVRELEQEEIIAPLDADAPAPALATEMDVATVTEPTFQTPVLLKYTDMQSLLLLDPIHDADTPGWPISKGNAQVG